MKHLGCRFGFQGSRYKHGCERHGADKRLGKRYHVSSSQNQTVGFANVREA